MRESMPSCLKEVIVMKLVNDSSSKPAAKDIEKRVEGIAEIQTLITQGVDSGMPTIFDKGAFLARMKFQHDRALNYNSELSKRALL
jgi:hypothetical protein